MINSINNIISLIPTGIVFIDNQRKVKYMNPYARDLLLEEDSFEKDIAHVHEGEDIKDKVILFFEKIKKEADTELPIVTTFKFNGKQKLLVIKLNKLYDKNNKFAGIVATIFDISTISCGNLENHNGSCTQFNKIPVVSNGSIKFIETQEIVFVKSLGSSTVIVTFNNEEYLTNFKISELESKLSHRGFFRSHKSYLVNLSYLKELITDKRSNGEKYKLHLIAKQSFFIPLSRRSKSKFTEIITGKSAF